MSFITVHVGSSDTEDKENEMSAVMLPQCYVSTKALSILSTKTRQTQQKKKKHTRQADEI